MKILLNKLKKKILCILSQKRNIKIISCISIVISLYALFSLNITFSLNNLHLVAEKIRVLEA